MIDPRLTHVQRIGTGVLTVGRFSYGWEHITFEGVNESRNVTIGSFCSIARDVRLILGRNHRTDWFSTFPFGHVHQEHLNVPPVPGHPRSNGDIEIGHDVWIGRSVTITSGVTVGNGAVIAANSHLVSRVQDYEIWGGNPARLIRPRFSKDVTDALRKISWWLLPIEKIEQIHQLLCSPATEEQLKQLEQAIRSL